jgi:hypothetical protein
MLSGDIKMKLIFWKKLPVTIPVTSLYILIASVGLTGCANINTPFDSFTGNSNSEYAGQPNVAVDASGTDDIPYAIQQYLEQIRVAQNNQFDEPTTSEKSDRLK